MSAVAVTVASGVRRMDLVLPGGVPAATLGAELAAGFGLSASVRLSRLTGPLSPDLDLPSQGVEDGAVLWLAPVSTPAPKVYDDATEALADVVGDARVPAWIRWLALTRARRRQGLGAVDVGRLELELRLLARLQLVVVLVVAVSSALLAWRAR